MIKASIKSMLLIGSLETKDGDGSKMTDEYTLKSSTESLCAFSMFYIDTKNTESLSIFLS